MPKIRTLQVTILSQREYLLEWTLSGDPAGETWTVERSDAPESHFQTLGTVLDGDQGFLDTQPMTYQKYIPYYYRVRYPDNSVSALARMPYQPDKYLIQHVWNVRRHLKRDNGVLCHYFHKQDYGIRCSLCYDPDLNKVVMKDCPECLGVGYENGYTDPVEIYISFPADSPQRMRIDYTEYNMLEPPAWTGPYPLLFPGDILIRDVDKEVFRVGDRVQRHGRRMNPARQLFQATAIERNAIEYNLIDRIVYA